MTVAQHFTLHQLNEGLFIKEVKKSRNKSSFFISGNGVDVSLNQLTWTKIYGMGMIKGDNNPANIHQHWVLSPKGQNFIKKNPFLS